ncbi:hypothetical protein [Catellatospora methionotrophica]|uniref:hypothetical protein n=1 Tax=Catellatospora methionotrophica TaxID=121620 RepID=UPI0033D9EB4E
MTIAELYADFAESEARDESPADALQGLAISRDDGDLALLRTLPPAKRQPQLVLGAVRFLGGPVDDPAAFDPGIYVPRKDRSPE